MPSQARQPRAKQATPTASDFHGAALLDEAGREIPITESMIQQACEQLEQHWHYPCEKHASSC